MDINHEKQWDANNMPFKGGRERYAMIKREDRPSINAQNQRKQQKLGPPPNIYQSIYPSEGSFSYNSYKMHYYCIQKTPEPKAILLYIHGINSHGGVSAYYAGIISKFNAQMNIYAIDMLNFGKSQGPFRGQIVSYEESVEQAIAFTDHLLQKFKKQPKIYLSGCSYGANIVLKMSVDHPSYYSGVIFISPAFRQIQEERSYLKKMALVLGYIYPRIRTVKQVYKGTKYNTEQIVKSDTCNYIDRVVAGSARALILSMRAMENYFDKFSSPYIVFQPGVEKYIDVFVSLDLQEASPSKDKTTIYCEHMWHSAFYEEEISGIAWQTAQWLKARI